MLSEWGAAGRVGFCQVRWVLPNKWGAAGRRRFW